MLGAVVMHFLPLLGMCSRLRGNEHMSFGNAKRGAKKKQGGTRTTGAACIVVLGPILRFGVRGNSEGVKMGNTVNSTFAACSKLASSPTGVIVGDDLFGLGE